jgi:hypothetical protein
MTFFEIHDPVDPQGEFHINLDMMVAYRVIQPNKVSIMMANPAADITKEFETSKELRDFLTRLETEIAGHKD